ncbi:hypothetical protein QDQ28_15555, partial [Clostridium perfringens]|nr:hypothetical protein [Clostridium perfringens]
DELNSIRKIAVKRVGKYTFTGDEEIIVFNILNDETEIGFEFFNLQLGFKHTGDNYPNAVSDNFAVYSTIYTGSKYEGIALNQNGKCYIRLAKTRLENQSVEGLKKWLKANPTNIYFELLEQIETPLT